MSADATRKFRSLLSQKTCNCEPSCLLVPQTRERTIIKSWFGLFDAGFAVFLCLAESPDTALSRWVTIVVWLIPGGGIDAIGRVALEPVTGRTVGRK